MFLNGVPTPSPLTPPLPPPRMIVQIATPAAGGLYALASDGTIWLLDASNNWTQVPGIPT